MKKAIALFLSIAMMATAMVGCAKKEEPAPAPSAPAASAPAASEPAKEELPSYNFQLGINTVEDSVRGEMAHVFGDYIKEASGGRLTLEVFPNSSLGGEQEMVEMVKTGSLDFTIPGVTALSNMNTNFGAYGLPFLVNTYEDAHALLDGDFGNALKDIAKENGYRILSWGDLGTVQITNNVRPIYSVEDM